LFGFLAVLYLLPIWAVRHLPTVDGPSHLYNSWVMAHLDNRTLYPQFAATFEIDERPLPNWFSSAVLLVLFRVVAPVTAEKVLVSGYVIVLLATFWYLAGAVSRERRWLAFLGFPFVYSLFLVMGFYNFCWSLAFYMLAVGLWWRRRGAPDLRTACAINAVLLLCYFSHVVSADLALVSIAVLWLCTLRRDNWRRHMLHVPILLPQVVLPLWFMLQGGLRVQPSASTLRVVLAGLIRLEALWAFKPARWTAIALSLAFAAAFIRSVVVRWLDVRRLDASPVATAASGAAPPVYRRDGPRVGARAPGAEAEGFAARRWWREEDSFLAVAVLLTMVYFLAPEGMAGGSSLKPRLSLYPFLALLPWLSLRLSRVTRAAAIGALAFIALAGLGTAWSCFQMMDERLTSYLRALDPVPPNSRVLPLSWDHDGGCVRAGIFVHALDYAALAKGLVDWNDYEAMTDYFPVRFKPNQQHASNFMMEWAPDTLPAERYDMWADSIVTWQMPVGAPVYGRIVRRYDEIPGHGPLRLFVRRRAIGMAAFVQRR
jgi:hypothetical protein